jgi:hypothetical protein
MDRVAFSRGACALAVKLGVWLTSACAALASGWAIQPMPHSPSVGDLEGVSCVSSRDCFAVGDAVEHWDGTTWAIEPTARPHGVLSGVSCVSPRACMAVGDGAWAWNGTDWSLHALTPLVRPKAAWANAVSCVSARDCIAVGGGRRGVAYRWNGKEWSHQTIPGLHEVDLFGVSCWSANDCVAVGDGAGKVDRGPRTVRWNGQRWSVQRSARLGDIVQATLHAVSCPSANACTAVGWVTPNHPERPPHPLVERYNGKKWSIQRTPSTRPYAMYGVSCASPTICTAVASTGVRSFAERWNGQYWSVQRIPPTPRNQLTAVRCPSPTFCTAVGFTTGHDPSAALAERWAASPFEILGVRTLANGTVRLLIQVPGPGAINVVETTCRKPAAAGCSADSRRSVFGRTHAHANRSRTLSATIKPNQRGRILIHDRTPPITLRVVITFTPIRGRRRTVVLPRIHLPTACSDHDNDCDTRDR